MELRAFNRHGAPSKVLQAAAEEIKILSQTTIDDLRSVLANKRREVCGLANFSSAAAILSVRSDRDLFTPIASLVDQSIRFESPRSTRGATKCGVRMAGDSHLHRLAYGRCVRSAERSGKRRTSDMPETKNERNAREARFWEAQKVRVILSGGWANCMRRSLMGAVRTSLVQAMCQNLPTTDKTLPDLLQYVLKHASQDPM
eukprot:scaffold30414_cov38-Tisochrysis_lutea.AAC.1